VLGRVAGVEGYHDTRSYPGAEHLPGLVIYRFDGPLFFANATTFRDEIRRLAKAQPKPAWILIAAEPVTDVDTTASDILTELDEALNTQGISLVFAELKDPVRRKIERYGLTRTINPDHFFPTIAAAVAAFRRETGAQWTAPDPSHDGEPADGEPADGRPAAGQRAADGGPPDIPATPSVG
jgi:MFS superfamily sulfate permease-like transporter